MYLAPINYQSRVSYNTPCFKQNVRAAQASVDSVSKNRKTILKGFVALLCSLGILKFANETAEKAAKEAEGRAAYENLKKALDGRISVKVNDNKTTELEKMAKHYAEEAAESEAKLAAEIKEKELDSSLKNAGISDLESDRYGVKFTYQGIEYRIESSKYDKSDNDLRSILNNYMNGIPLPDDVSVVVVKNSTLPHPSTIKNGKVTGGYVGYIDTRGSRDIDVFQYEMEYEYNGKKYTAKITQYERDFKYPPRFELEMEAETQVRKMIEEDTAKLENMTKGLFENAVKMARSNQQKISKGFTIKQMVVGENEAVAFLDIEGKQYKVEYKNSLLARKQMEELITKVKNGETTELKFYDEEGKIIKNPFKNAG